MAVGFGAFGEFDLDPRKLFAAQLRQPASAAGGTQAGAARPTPRRTPVRHDLVRSADLTGDLRGSDIALSQTDAVSHLSAPNRGGGDRVSKQTRQYE